MVTLTVEQGDAAPPMGRACRGSEGFACVSSPPGCRSSRRSRSCSALPPEVAGIYFKGFVIAYGLAALLRGKYELFIAHSLHRPLFADAVRHAAPRALVRALGIRVLIRSAIACAAFLVVTADLDVMDVYLHPYLETYLPFVLAVPFATLALFLASTLRAVTARWAA